MRDVDDILDRLQRSAFRARFRLGQRDRAYVDAKGLTLVLAHAHDFVDTRLAAAHPRNDGKQTPFKGHPVFIAQHATATCCRGCLAKWHSIAAGRELDERQRAYVVAVIARWLEQQLERNDRPRPRQPTSRNSSSDGRCERQAAADRGGAKRP